jgi:hydrogenase maturation protein HypF
VQGVGFRPMVCQLAASLRLSGNVKNGNDGLHIFLNAAKPVAEEFLQKILLSPPEKSKIISSVIYKIPHQIFNGFLINVEETCEGKKKTLLPQDTALCNDCRKELHDKNNRRYRYPFITCTQCGPRYSIINELPYERNVTSMHPFVMCNNCYTEYTNLNDPRFFSQTNSCTNCGIALKLWKDEVTILSDNTADILLLIKNFLLQGNILAVKGIGGYLLLCSGNNAEAIRLLRKRKNRHSKPFAVLYPDVATVQKNFRVSATEKILLGSEEAPIVLLSPKQLAFQNVAVQDIAPGLSRLGIILPYSPLLEIITKDCGIPLVATSANISGSPIIYKDDDALAYLFDVADYVVSYNRDIIFPQDDSVVQVSSKSNQQIIVRRSRGYAPSFVNYKPKKENCILSTGAFLKSSFTLSVNGHVFISQFLGSGQSYESQQMYKDTLQHLLHIYAIKPDVILTDKHPNCFSHQYAVELTKQMNVDIHFIQHHQAHFAAVLAENNLLNSDKAVLGVIWDGTGLGNDGNIWGGEFFHYQNNEMLRCYHFDYFPVIAGDKQAMEPRISALCTSYETWPQPQLIKDKFTATEWNNYQALIQSTTLFSSSVGRIFDAVASLLNICDKQTYEGEAAMYLQALAETYVDEYGFIMSDSYFKEGAHYYRIPTASLINGIATDIKKGKQRNYIAAKFHYSLVCLVGIVAEYVQVQKICFSGGVFQNALLVDWLQYQYKEKYEIYFHKKLSPNDENISFGQLVYYDNNVKTISDMVLQQEINIYNP